MKHIFSTFLILFTSFHIMATAAYLGPANSITNRHSNLFLSYMDTFFRQDWHLFSPDPLISDSYLWIRCMNEAGVWSGWMDPSLKLRKLHNRTILTGAGKVLFIYRHIADHLKAAHTTLNGDPQALLSDVDFKNAARLAGRFCQNHVEKSVIGEVKITTIFPIKYSQRLDESRRKSIQSQRFPLFSISEATK